MSLKKDSNEWQDQQISDLYQNIADHQPRLESIQFIKKEAQEKAKRLARKKRAGGHFWLRWRLSYGLPAFACACLALGLFALYDQKDRYHLAQNDDWTLGHLTETEEEKPNSAFIAAPNTPSPKNIKPKPSYSFVLNQGSPNNYNTSLSLDSDTLSSFHFQKLSQQKLFVTTPQKKSFAPLNEVASNVSAQKSNNQGQLVGQKSKNYYQPNQAFDSDPTKTRFLKRLAKMMQDDADLLFLNARRLKNSGQIEKALADFELLYRFYPQYTYLSDVLIYRAQCFALLGQPKKAINSLHVLAARDAKRAKFAKALIDYIEATGQFPSRLGNYR